MANSRHQIGDVQKQIILLDHTSLANTWSNPFAIGTNTGLAEIFVLSERKRAGLQVTQHIIYDPRTRVPCQKK